MSALADWTLVRRAQTHAETVWMHEGCPGRGPGGPVYFTLRGGFCMQRGAGPLHPYAPPRYVRQDYALSGGC